MNRYGDEGPGPKGAVMTAKFMIEGQEFVALNGGPQFTFSEAISFVINCETQDEIDDYWENLSEEGEEQGPGWVKDKYGLSWQIVPTILEELMNSGDSSKSQRVMMAMMGMYKMDIEKLRQAYDK